MARIVEHGLRVYGVLVRCGGKLQHPLLLLLRLYFGWTFFVAGKGKLMNLKATASTFEMWEIPMPQFNAFMAGITETVLGLTFLAGLAGRVSAIPLIVVMIVAYLTAHRAEVDSLNDFVGAAPFDHLLACLIVLAFGPGLFSVDGLVVKMWKGRPGASGPGETKGEAGAAPAH